MRYILPISVIFIFLCVFATGSPVAQWNFSYEASAASCSLQNDTLHVSVENGVAYLTTRILNITNILEEGTRISTNIRVELSATSIRSGMKIIVANDTLFHKSLSSGKINVQFYLLRTYNASDKVTIVFYDYGGIMDVKMGAFSVEKSRGGVSEGLLLSGIGISVVFSVLSILAVVMYFFRALIKDERHNAKFEIKKSTQSNEKGSVKEMDDEIIAAITGAISLYLGGKKFKIISVKPSPWKYYGRMAGMRRR